MFEGLYNEANFFHVFKYLRGKLRLFDEQGDDSGPALAMRSREFKNSDLAADVHSSNFISWSIVAYPTTR